MYNKLGFQQGMERKENGVINKNIYSILLDQMTFQ